MMEPIRDAFRAVLRSVELRAPPSSPISSNVTGTWATAAQVTDPEHWIAHLLGTVRFSEAVGEALARAGPHPPRAGTRPEYRGSLALQHPASSGASGAVTFASVRHEYDRQEDQAYLLKTLGQLWLAGVDRSGRLLQGERRRRVPLPTYPFERQRYWLDRPAAPGPQAAAERKAAPAAKPAGKVAERENWFYAPSWRLAPRPRAAALREPEEGLCLLLLDELGPRRPAGRLSGSARRRGGDRRSRAGLRPAGRAELLPRSDQCGRLRGSPPGAGSGAEQDPPSLESHGETKPAGSAAATYETAQARGFHSLLALTQALGRQGLSTQTDIAVVTNGLCGVERNDPLAPEKATLVGPARVISQEYPSVSCRAIDVDPCEPAESLAAALLAELAGSDSRPAPIVALRGDRRWLPAAEALPLPSPASSPAPLRPGGVYLITGGLGGLGLGLADHLARTVGAKLALLGRTGLPAGPERGTDPRRRA